MYSLLNEGFLFFILGFILVLTIYFLVYISIAIGREGGVVPLIALARSETEVSLSLSHQPMSEFPSHYQTFL